MTFTAQPHYRSLAPTADQLSDVLPTDRLFASGKVKPGTTPGLRDIPDGRNAVAFVSVYFQLFGALVLAARIDHPLGWLAMLIWSARCLSMLNLLNHEAVHALLFSNRRLNDTIARYLLAPVAFTDFDGYRKAHLAHHKVELGPDEPDVSMYAPYPSGRWRLARRLGRDLVGISGFKLLVGVSRAPMVIRRRILLGQLAMFVITYAVTGRWWAWLVVWFLPWLTTWQVTNRLRAIAEHGGMEAGNDRRVTTHVVTPGPMAGFMLAPYQAGYHLAHHVDTSVPWNKLRVLHAELERAGWITAELTHPSYRALWRYLATGQRR